MTEQEFQRLADRLCDEHGRPRIRCRIVDAKRGIAYASSISIPAWALAQGRAYTLAYALHEIAHHLTQRGHDRVFREMEARLLAAHGLSATWGRVYITELRDSATGAAVWRKEGAALRARAAGQRALEEF